MKLYRNSNEITSKETLGRRISLGGLGILMIGLLASLVPNWYPTPESATTTITQFLQQRWALISFIALPIGFVCASTGSYFINRFARRRWPGLKQLARPDEVLTRNMKGLDDKYAFFSWSLPASYVLVGPCGVLVFVTRGDKGRVNVDGDKWREPFKLSRFFTVFAREGVGNPTREVNDQVQKIRNLLNKEDNFVDVPIDAAVVFLNQDVELNLQNPSIETLRVEQVKAYIRRKAKEVKLATSMHKAVTRFLEEQSKHDER